MNFHAAKYCILRKTFKQHLTLITSLPISEKDKKNCLLLLVNIEA